ncbi:MAG TPA: response regulator [Candidatus Omnitrophota bacterium]|jgi:DNA-binding response OmpR family regulator|nr:response regulator [Candidatus Omnitrophota bacterium]HSA31328.1 response regulator [Candidatus Omnitrophota bacterium]
MNTDITKKILVIDDNPTDLKLIASLLKSETCAVIAVEDAAQGLEMAMTMKPDLLVLDVMMPIINGYNICRLLKSHPDCCRIPVLLVTSRSTEEDKKIGEEVGADSYMSKPFDPDLLIKTVKQLLEG